MGILLALRMRKNLIFLTLVSLLFCSCGKQPARIGDKTYDLQKFAFEINPKTFYPPNPNDKTGLPYTIDDHAFRMQHNDYDSLLCRGYYSHNPSENNYRTKTLAKWGKVNFNTIDLFENAKEKIVAIRCLAQNLNPIETDHFIEDISKDFGKYKNSELSNISDNYFWSKNGTRIKLIVKQTDIEAPKDSLTTASVSRFYKENLTVYIYRLAFVPISEKLIDNGDAFNRFKDFIIPDEEKYKPKQPYGF
jgi:hypothetical protein